MWSCDQSFATLPLLWEQLSQLQLYVQIILREVLFRVKTDTRYNLEIIEKCRKSVQIKIF